MYRIGKLLGGGLRTWDKIFKPDTVEIEGNSIIITRSFLGLVDNIEEVKIKNITSVRRYSNVKYTNIILEISSRNKKNIVLRGFDRIDASSFVRKLDNIMEVN